MRHTRREFLRLLGVISAGSVAASAGCSPIYRHLAGGINTIGTHISPETVKHFRALSRMTFGPTPEELLLADVLGLEKWVAEQLDFETIDDNAANLRVRQFNRLEMNADELEKYEKQDIIADLKSATLLRQIYSKRQLYERMVEFWTDHFNISVNKDMSWALKVVDDREVIRKHALGNFRDLLGASTHSPGMLYYLDNWANHKDHPNENYARELLELHTLGVNGGYSQQDVMELARCLTGWTVKKHFWRGEYTFDEKMHDNGEKTILGFTVKPSGALEIEQVLDLLASHPATATHLALKLVRYFIIDDPLEKAPDLVRRTAQTFLDSGGDIKVVLRVMLLAGLPILNESNRKFKRPSQFLISALRMLGAETDGKREVWHRLNLMGQPSFEWPTPDGPPSHSNQWKNNLMPRWKFAYDLARDQFETTFIDFKHILSTRQRSDIDDFLDAFSLRLLGFPYPEREKQDIFGAINPGWENEHVARIIVAGLIASPAFQWI